MQGFFIGVASALVALTAGLGFVMFAMYAPPRAKQPADAFARREPPQVVQPETTGMAPREVRVAVPNASANAKPFEISKKKDKAAARAERKKEHKARREERKKEMRPKV